MNADIAKQWAAELRSGKWKQATGTLSDKGEAFCCLGLLCEMAHAAGKVERGVIGHAVCYGENKETGVLPTEVKEWAGMKYPLGSYGVEHEYEDDEEGAGNLANDNDAGVTFPEIADLIEKHAEEL